MEQIQPAPVETLSPQAIKQWVKFFDVLMEVDFEVQQQERKEGFLTKIAP